MTRTITIICIILGLITIGSGIYAFVKGTEGPVHGFALFMGLALAGTSVFTKTVTQRSDR